MGHTAYLHHGTYFDGSKAGGGDASGDLHRGLLIRCFDQEIAAQLLARFGERAFRNEVLAFAHAHAAGGSDRLQGRRGQKVPARVKFLRVLCRFDVTFFTLGLAEHVLVCIDQQHVSHESAFTDKSNDGSPDRQVLERNYATAERASLSTMPKTAEVLSEKIKPAMARTNDLFNREVFGKRNFDALDEIYTADARILPPGSAMVSGRKAIKEFWSNLVQSTNARSAELTSLDTIPAGEGAVEIGRAVLTIEPQGAPTSMEVKYVVYWREEDDRWKWHVDIWNPNA